MAEQAKLKVMEALQEEAYKGIIRIDSETMHAIGIRPGDVVEIEGEKKTVGIADRAYPTDVGQTVIRMDGIMRKNARTGIGETVIVRKADIKEAKEIMVAPAQKEVVIQADPNIFKRGLLGRALLKGDIVVLGGARRRRRTLSGSPFEDIFDALERDFIGNFGLGSLRFVIAETTPKQAVIVTENTVVKVSSKAVEITEEKIPDVTYEDIGGLDEEIRKVREMVELPLKYPEVFERLGVSPPAGVLLHGPPGSGKTLLAKAVANESDANFILLNGPECVNKFYGESEKRIRDLFEAAEKSAPSIIFIDEIDAIAPKREEVHGEVERRMVSTLLTQMDGLKSRGKVVVIGASVTGDTPILIKDEKGIKLMLIKDFVDSYYKIGEENVEKNLENKFALGFNALKQKKNFPFLRFGNSDFKKIGGVFRHKVREIYEIEYLGGKIRTTGNHSVFIRTKNGLVAKPAVELKPGDVLVDLPYKVNSKTLRSYIPIAEEFSLTLPVNDLQLITYYYDYALNGGDTMLLSRMAGKHISTIYNWKRSKTLPRELNNAYYDTLPQKIKVTPELMKLLGYYTAEGYAREEVDFCFGSHEGELVEDLKKSMKNIFNVEPSKINLKENRINIVYNITPLARFFAKYCGKGAHKKHLPSFLFEAPKKYFLAFLLGYVLGDGHITKEGKITVVSVSKQLILELNWLCRMHGIKSFIDSYIVKAGRKIGKNVIKKETIAYRLGIPKTSNPFISKNKTKNYVKKPVIKKITKLSYNDYVYDLCGCENEAFFGGESPLLLHNTNRINAIDPALRRPGRFDREISLGVPDKKGRLNILKIHTRNMPLTKDVNLEELAAITHGFVGADLQALCKEAAMNVLRKVMPDLKLREKEELQKEVLEKLIVSAQDFREALRLVRPSAMREVLVETPNIGWNDIGGLEEIKQQLMEAIEWPLKHPQSFKNLGIRPPRGILLYGPTGTGKTLLAKAVAKESEANFILVKGPELLNKFVGESERGIRKVFEKARQIAPSIIFFDEIDSLAPKRGMDLSTDVTERVVNSILAEMDGLQELTDVVIIGATNRIDMVDTALLRPGRFDRILLTPIPDKKSRVGIFKIHTKNMPLAKDVKLETLIEKTDGFVGADIESLCREAAILALRENIEAKEVKKKHFDAALKKIRRSVPKEVAEEYENIDKELKKPKEETVSYTG